MSRAKEIALSWVDGNRDLIVGLSDSIWEYAELPMREFRSSRLIAETLGGTIRLDPSKEGATSIIVSLPAPRGPK